MMGSQMFLSKNIIAQYTQEETTSMKVCGETPLYMKSESYNLKNVDVNYDENSKYQLQPALDLRSLYNHKFP